ncbi:hypothetical protein [Sulfitobacter dubius]|uniref:hypothetical protein n=1 Tax=Sulfitobacter dubius TaxID=218673 RepID=UPI0008E7C2A2|nr:hypothetical protein [Sulfitobacter dubius]SFG22865.1 hypothetical protein SAMN04488039_101169 [Sulfitobacter dubius]
MAERKRSNDGTQETEEFVSDAETPSQGGRAGGDLQKDVGTQDAERRAEKGDDGVTRVTGEDKRNHGEAS